MRVNRLPPQCSTSNIDLPPVNWRFSSRTTIGRRTHRKHRIAKSNMLEIEEHNKDDCIRLINMIICELPLIKSLSDDCVLDRLSQLMAILDSNYEINDTSVSALNASHQSLELVIREWLTKFYNANSFIDGLNFSDEEDRTKLAILIINIMCKLRHSLQDIKAYLDDCQSFNEFDEQLNDITRNDKLLELLQLDLNRWKSEARHYKVKLDEFTKLFEKYEQNGIRSKSITTCDKETQVSPNHFRVNNNNNNNNKFTMNLNGCENNGKQSPDNSDATKESPVIHLYHLKIEKSSDGGVKSFNHHNSNNNNSSGGSSGSLNYEPDLITGINNDRKMIVVCGDDKESDILCSVCHKHFKANYEYNLHLLEEHVLEERNTNADYQSQSQSPNRNIRKTRKSSRFSSKSNAFLKSFKCTFNGCVKTFPRRYQLMRHLRTHEPKNKRLLFSCQYPNCDKKYTALNHLKDHAKKKHNFSGSSQRAATHQQSVKEPLKEENTESNNNLLSLSNDDLMRNSSEDKEMSDDSNVGCCDTTTLFPIEANAIDNDSLDDSRNTDDDFHINSIASDSSLNLVNDISVLIDHQYSL